MEYFHKYTLHGVFVFYFSQMLYSDYFAFEKKKVQAKTKDIENVSFQNFKMLLIFNLNAFSSSAETIQCLTKIVFLLIPGCCFVGQTD